MKKKITLESPINILSKEKTVKAIAYDPGVNSLYITYDIVALDQEGEPAFVIQKQVTAEINKYRMRQEEDLKILVDLLKKIADKELEKEK
jgi:hypothetical protein